MMRTYDVVSISSEKTLWQGFNANEEGSSLIEISLLLPIIVLILLSATQVGLYIQRTLVVIEAASVGARFGIISGNAGNMNGMVQAAQSASDGLSGFNAIATTFCSCSPGGALVSCSSSCSSGAVSHYVQVTASATIPAILQVTGLPASMHPAATSTMRASWPGQ